MSGVRIFLKVLLILFLTLVWLSIKFTFIDSFVPLNSASSLKLFLAQLIIQYLVHGVVFATGIYVLCSVFFNTIGRDLNIRKSLVVSYFVIVTGLNLIATLPLIRLWDLNQIPPPPQSLASQYHYRPYDIVSGDQIDVRFSSDMSKDALLVFYKQQGFSLEDAHLGPYLLGPHNLYTFHSILKNGRNVYTGISNMNPDGSLSSQTHISFSILTY